MREPLNADRSSADSTDLLERVAAGDAAAFTAIYDTFSPRVLGLITRLLRDHAQSEEVAQEVFLEVWQTAGRFASAKGTAATWIMTMAHRRAIDRIRASQASRDRDLRIGIRDHEHGFDVVSETVEVTVEDARVRRALALLTAHQRRSITLCYYEGLGYAEAAAELGVAVGTVKTRLRDGLIRLRRLLAEESGLRGAA